MKKLKFTDCVDIVGSSCHKFDGTKVYVSTGAVDTDRIEPLDTEIVDYDGRPSRANLVAEENDILFAKMQATEKTLLIDEELSKHIYSTGFCAVRAKDHIITNKCLYYLLTTETFLEQKDKNCSGATQKAITNAGLEKIVISVPDLEQQTAFVEQMDAVRSMIVYRKEQLKKLDELVKSRFIELFGLLENPTKEFPKDVLKNLCIKITDGKHGGCTTEAGTGRYFVGAREIYNDTVHYDTAPEINLSEFEKDYKRCNVEIGDFLIVNTGATIGKSAIAIDPRTECTLLQKSVALLKVKSELLNPVFLQYCYKVNDKMYKVESASAQPNLLLSKINSTEIYVPPIDLQNEFATFVEQTDKLKFEVKEALEKLETLKKSLMQECFG